MKEYYNKSIHIFVKESSNRLVYIFDFIFKEQFGLNYELCFNETDFKEIKTCKLNYSSIEFQGVININPQGILTEKGIKKFNFNTLTEDIFALSFFLLSRYEEYLPYKADFHNRFSAKESYLYSINKLQKPIVDEALQELKNNIKRKYPNIIFEEKHFKVLPTIDIDQVSMFKHKSWKRIIGGQIRDFFKLNWKNLINRKLVIFGLKNDPYIVYEEIKKRFYNKQLTFFFLMGDIAEFDNSLHWKNKDFRRIINDVKGFANVGLHPSYASNNNLETLKLEKNRLENIVSETITKSRQHYIKLHLPQTYNNLISSGIKTDYSMGFADAIGFRAGTSQSFFWYDLSQEKITDLRVIPFCAMDVSLKSYMNLNLEQSEEVLMKLKENLEKVNGNFCILLHNESLSNYGEWKNWNEMFYKVLS